MMPLTVKDWARRAVFELRQMTNKTVKATHEWGRGRPRTCNHSSFILQISYLPKASGHFRRADDLAIGREQTAFFEFGAKCVRKYQLLLDRVLLEHRHERDRVDLAGGQNIPVEAEFRECAAVVGFEERPVYIGAVLMIDR